MLQSTIIGVLRLDRLLGIKSAAAGWSAYEVIFWHCSVMHGGNAKFPSSWKAPPQREE